MASVMGLYCDFHGVEGVGVECTKDLQPGVNIAWSNGLSRFYRNDELRSYKVEKISRVLPIAEMVSELPQNVETLPVPEAAEAAADNATEQAMNNQEQSVPPQADHQTVVQNTEFINDTAFENAWIKDFLTKNGIEVTNKSVIEAAAAEGMKIQSGQVTAVKSELLPTGA